MNHLRIDPTFFHVDVVEVLSPWSKLDKVEVEREFFA
jgi:hypothetical protein